MVVFLSCQLFHKEVLRQSISHKYLMRGQWQVSICSMSHFISCKSVFVVLSPYISIFPNLQSDIVSGGSVSTSNPTPPLIISFSFSSSSSIIFSSGFVQELQLGSHLSSSFCMFSISEQSASNICSLKLFLCLSLYTSPIETVVSCALPVTMYLDYLAAS